MAKKKSKSLSDMKTEEIDEQIKKPVWSVAYKDLEFVAYENSFYDERPMLSCYVFKKGTMIEHSGRTRYFTKQKALDELKWKYKAYLETEVIRILKEKAQIFVGGNSELTAYISIHFAYSDPQEWEKIKEYFSDEEVD